MKKTRKLVLNRETLHSMELRSVAGAGSIAVCTTLAGTTQTTGASNTYVSWGPGCTGYTSDDSCTTGGACSTSGSC